MSQSAATGAAPRQGWLNGGGKSAPTTAMRPEISIRVPMLTVRYLDRHPHSEARSERGLGDPEYFESAGDIELFGTRIAGDTERMPANISSELAALGDQ